MTDATTTTPPTAADAAAAQATLDAYKANQKAAANAAALAALTPLAFMAGPGWAADAAAIKANWSAVMQNNATMGQGLMNLSTVLDNVTLLFTSAFTAAGGVAPTT